MPRPAASQLLPSPPTPHWRVNLIASIRSKHHQLNALGSGFVRPFANCDTPSYHAPIIKPASSLSRCHAIALVVSMPAQAAMTQTGLLPWRAAHMSNLRSWNTKEKGIRGSSSDDRHLTRTTLTAPHAPEDYHSIGSTAKKKGRT